MEQPQQLGSRHLGCKNLKPRVEDLGVLVLALPLRCCVTLDKSFILSRPHSSFQYLLSEDYGAKHHSHAGSMKAP